MNARTIKHAAAGTMLTSGAAISATPCVGPGVDDIGADDHHTKPVLAL